jgi:hypothetical protein
MNAYFVWQKQIKSSEDEIPKWSINKGNNKGSNTKLAY